MGERHVSTAIIHLLYWLFVRPNSNGAANEVANRAAYTRVMQLGEATLVRLAARYDELMETGLAYFTATHPTRELRQALDRSISEVSLLTCSLIARYVLYSTATESKRRQRLSTMGFDATGAIWKFGADQWVTTILAVIVLGAGMMVFLPGTLSLEASRILTISVTFALSIGFAVIGGVWAARRFLERHDRELSADPPIAELTLAALIVAGLSIGLRIAFPLVPALIQGSSTALPDAINMFIQRWPGIIIPFACTISLGLLCAYVGARPWRQFRVAAAGALGNGLAFMLAALFVAWLVSDDALGTIYKPDAPARLLMIVNTGLIGAAIGAIVLWQFKRLELARLAEAAHAAERMSTGAPWLAALKPPECLDPAAPTKPGVAAQIYGGYSYESVSDLVGRYVLYSTATESKRRQRLSTMGFDATGAIWKFGADQWVTTILAVIVLGAGMMVFLPGTLSLEASRILTISVTFALSIGFAVIGGVWAARRFLERHDRELSADPPIAELTLAALIVAGLSIGLRIAFPLVPALIQGSSTALPDAINMFIQRWPGIIIPFACTISLGLLCAYVGARPWRQFRVAAAGALGNGLAFMLAALFVAWLVSDAALGTIYKPDAPARLLMIVNTGLIGAAIGAIVLWQFKRLELARLAEAAHAAERMSTGAPWLAALKPPECLDPAAPTKPGVAAQIYGGYSYESVSDLVGRYICFRPALTAAGVISAYLIDVHWDKETSCLTFDEKDREDAAHAQRGRVYILDGRQFMSLVTVEGGSIRLVTVFAPGRREDRARPDHDAFQSERYPVHPGKRTNRAQAARGSETPTRVHPAGRARVRVLPRGAGGGRTRVRLLRRRAADGPERRCKTHRGRRGDTIGPRGVKAAAEGKPRNGG